MLLWIVVLNRYIFIFLFLVVCMNKKELTAEHPIVAKKIDKSLKMSVREGSLSSVSSGLGLSYFSPFALAMNATASQIGILHAIINLLPALVQLKASMLISNFSRKRVVLFGVLAQILLWIPILLTGVLFFIGVPHMVWAFIGLVGLFYAVSAVDHPAWFSWMGSIVPEENRGKYFSRRNRVAGFFGVIAMVAGAFVLDYVKSFGGARGEVLGFTLIGFGFLFVIAGLVRFWSWTLLASQYEPRLKVRKKDRFSFWSFLKMAPHTAFGRFSLFRGVFSIMIGVAGAFWAVYMLRELAFSYVWFMAITVSGTLFQLMFLPLLGKFSDRFGNIKLMQISSILIFVIPGLWLLSALISSDIGVKIYLLFVPAIVSGFAWAGYNLAANNYVYDAVKNRKQAFGVSYMNLLVGVGTFIGASIGTFIAWMGVPFMDTILFIFLVSMVGRFFVAIFGVRFLREVRHVHKFSSQYLIRELSPMRGIVREVHSLEHLVKRVEHHL